MWLQLISKVSKEHYVPFNHKQASETLSFLWDTTRDFLPFHLRNSGQAWALVLKNKRLKKWPHLSSYNVIADQIALIHKPAQRVLCFLTDSETERRMGLRASLRSPSPDYLSGSRILIALESAFCSCCCPAVPKNNLAFPYTGAYCCLLSKKISKINSRPPNLPNTGHPGWALIFSLLSHEHVGTAAPGALGSEPRLLQRLYKRQIQQVPGDQHLYKWTSFLSFLTGFWEFAHLHGQDPPFSVSSTWKERRAEGFHSAYQRCPGQHRRGVYLPFGGNGELKVPQTLLVQCCRDAGSPCALPAL